MFMLTNDTVLLQQNRRLNSNEIVQNKTLHQKLIILIDLQLAANVSFVLSIATKTLSPNAWRSKWLGVRNAPGL